jgi:hypothetical protein
LEFEGNATDLSSNGNNGTLNGDAGFAAGLVSGQWLILDGSGDFVSIPNAASLNMTGAVTISAWMKLNNHVPNNTIISKRDSYSSTGIPYEVVIDAGVVSFRVIGNDRLDTGDLIAADGLYHVQCGWDGTTAEVCVNGVSITTGTRTGPITPNTQPVIIGGLPGGGENAAGAIDRVFVFNTRKTAADALAEYMGITSPTPAGSGNQHLSMLGIG